MYGGPISFASKRLRVIATSSAEAEYAAASYACKEVVFVRNLLTDLGFKLSGPTVELVDNMAAIKIAENNGVTAHTKHFAHAIHLIRHHLHHGTVALYFVGTRSQQADGLTKALDKHKFLEWVSPIPGVAQPLDKRFAES